MKDVEYFRKEINFNYDDILRIYCDACFRSFVSHIYLEKNVLNDDHRVKNKFDRNKRLIIVLC